MTIHRVVTLALDEPKERGSGRPRWDIPLAAAFVVAVSATAWFAFLSVAKWVLLPS